MMLAGISDLNGDTNGVAMMRFRSEDECLFCLDFKITSQMVLLALVTHGKGLM